jgi:hypothetical protein
MAALIVRTTTMPTSKHVAPRAYQINRACIVLDISRSKAYSDMQSGSLPYVLIGGRRHITADVIEALVRGEHPSQAQPTRPRRKRAAA